MGQPQTAPAPQAGRAPRRRAQHKTLTDSMTAAGAVKKRPSALRTRACGLLSRAPVPKVIPEEIKARIRELLISGETASAVVRAIANDGVARVSVPTVAKIAQRLGIKLVRGSVPGSPLAREIYSGATVLTMNASRGFNAPEGAQEAVFIYGAD